VYLILTNNILGSFILVTKSAIELKFKFV